MNIMDNIDKILFWLSTEINLFMDHTLKSCLYLTRQFFIQVIPKLFCVFKAFFIAVFELFVNILLFCFYDVLYVIISLVISFWNMKTGEALMLIIAAILILILFFKVDMPFFGIVITLLFMGSVVKVRYHETKNINQKHHVPKANCAQLNFGKSIHQSDNLFISEISKASNRYRFIEGLVGHSWLYNNHIGKDAAHLHHTGLRVCAIFQVTNKELLKIYKQKLTETPTISLPTIPYPIRTTTYAHNYDNYMSIDKQKEVYLFHGTKNHNVESIVKYGFLIDKAGNGLYGKAIYLTDSCQKADQYSDTTNHRIYKDTYVFAMLLVRASLGVTCKANIRHKTKCHSTIGGKAVTNTMKFHEFMFQDTKQLYVDYVIFYERKYNDSNEEDTNVREGLVWFLFIGLVSVVFLFEYISK